LITLTGRPKISVRATILGFGQIIAKTPFVWIKSGCCKKSTSPPHPYFSAANKDFTSRFSVDVAFYKHPPNFQLILPYSNPVILNKAQRSEESLLRPPFFCC
jgi:hypothetical protein